MATTSTGVKALYTAQQANRSNTMKTSKMAKGRGRGRGKPKPRPSR
jgi:hypothetical protein